jgi:hypothetical protein
MKTQILELLEQGVSQRNIAAQLGISLGSVQNAKRGLIQSDVTVLNETTVLTETDENDDCVNTDNVTVLTEIDETNDIDVVPMTLQRFMTSTQQELIDSPQVVRKNTQSVDDRMCNSYFFSNNERKFLCGDEYDRNVFISIAP